MSNARNLADIVTGNFDVPLGALDNVPPSNDASALTTGTLPVGRLPSSGVNASSLTTGALGTARLPAGSVLQVVSATKTDKFTTTSTSYTTITGMTVTVTPSSASNKVLVSFNLNAGIPNAAGAIRIYRGETPIAIGNEIQEPINNRMSVNVYNGGDDANSTPNFSMSILDTPSTTSATTYTLRACCAQSTGTIVVNDQTSQVRNVSYSAVTASTLTVMEIAG